jgi:hypothetical protein
MASTSVLPGLRDGAGRQQGGDRLREKIESAIEAGVVAAILYDATGMRDRGAVAAEHQADLGEAEAEDDVGEIHGHLPSQRHPSAATGCSNDVAVPNAEDPGDGQFDGEPKAAFVTWHPPVKSEIDNRRTL